MRVARYRFVVVALLLQSIVMGCDEKDPLAPSLEARSTGSGPAVNAPSGANAVAGSYDRIDVSWVDNSSNETGFEVHRSSTGPSGAFTLLATTGASATSYSNGGLSGSSQYCYEVRALRATGNKKTHSAFSNVACATTFAPPVPAAPSAVSAAPSPYSRIVVTWTDNASNESGFRVDRSATMSGPWTTVGTVGPNVVALNDNQPPAAEQPACYRVFAFNSFGDSPSSNVQCTMVPAVPSGLAASATGSGIDLTWTDNSAVEDGFQVQRWTASSPIIVVATLPANTTAYRDAGLADDTYYYQVRATKDGGTSGGSNNASAMVVTMPPNAPSQTDALPYSSSIAQVGWLAGSANAEGFRIERSADGGTNWNSAGTTSAELWFYDVNQLSERPLCYRVIAFNRIGESAPSGSDCTTLPAAPTNLTATWDAQGITLSWTDNSAVEDGYSVLVETACYYDPIVWIAALPSDATSFVDVGPYFDCGSYALSYLVAAIKDGGTSDYASVPTPAAPGSSSVGRTSTSTRLTASPRTSNRRGEP